MKRHSIKRIILFSLLTVVVFIHAIPSIAQGIFIPIAGTPSAPLNTECKIRVLFVYSDLARNRIRSAAVNPANERNGVRFQTIEAVSVESLRLLNDAFSRSAIEEANPDPSQPNIQTRFALAGYLSVSNGLSRDNAVVNGYTALQWWNYEDQTFCDLVADGDIDRAIEISSADLVVLVKRHTRNHARAWQIGPATEDQSAIIMNADFMIVTDPNSNIAYSLAHEVGHIFGCDHDMWNITPQSGGTNTCGMIAVHGAESTRTGNGLAGVGTNRGAFFQDGVNWKRTIMAYNGRGGANPDGTAWPIPAGTTPQLTNPFFSEPLTQNGNNTYSCKEKILARNGDISRFRVAPDVSLFSGFALDDHEQLLPIARRQIQISTIVDPTVPSDLNVLAGNFDFQTNAVVLLETVAGGGTNSVNISSLLPLTSSLDDPCPNEDDIPIDVIANKATSGNPPIGSFDRKSGHGLQLISMFPNPTSLETQIEFTLAKEGSFHTELVSVLGNVVKKSPTRTLKKGNYREYINVGDLPNGTYLLRMHMAGLGFLSTKLMVLK